MGVVVRDADLTSDRDHIVDLQKRYLTEHSNNERFEWLYKKNPFGLPRVWVAQESNTSAIIGVAAAFPRSFYIGSNKKTGWVLGDFCISEEYRSLGPAIQLQRACLEGLKHEASTIWYDFPSAKMLAIYKRLKTPPPGKMIRFVRPLRVDRKVRTWVNSRLLQLCLSMVGNTVLDLGHGRVKSFTGLTFARHEGGFGDEFSELAERIGGTGGNCLERTSAYLNWRYRDNPLGCYLLLTARFEGELKGYAVYTETELVATIIDIFGFQEKNVIVGLLDAIVRNVRFRGSETVDVSIIEGHPWIPFLQSGGFRPRETAPVIITDLHLGTVDKTTDDRQASLLLMQGDRDS